MPVQQIELEEVQMVEVSDESLESVAIEADVTGAYTGGPPYCN
jgi:hypothetical protein